MKRILSAVTAVIIMALSLTGCEKNAALVPVSGEIIESDNGYIVSFVISNTTGETIENLSAVVAVYSDKTTVAEEKEVVYPLPVADGASATLSVSTEKKCVSGKIVSFSYKNEKGKIQNGEFKDDFVAYIKKTSSEANTREQLAQELIRDIKTQFLKKGRLSTGSYDPEKKQLVIVSKYGESYDVCAALYKKNPDSWKELSDGIVQMSQSCYDEFKNNNFDDVNVNVGIISSDEELLFSATNGSLVESLDSE